jgi:hypothetical protein
MAWQNWAIDTPAGAGKVHNGKLNAASLGYPPILKRCHKKSAPPGMILEGQLVD